MILNKTRKERTPLKIVNADTFFKRFMGLMGRKEIDFALLFCNLKDSTIHTHFMRFEIDVYFMDENKIVFEKATLKPWRFYRPSKKAEYILETEKNKLKLEIGDRLDFI